MELKASAAGGPGRNKYGKSDEVTDRSDRHEASRDLEEIIPVALGSNSA